MARIVEKYTVTVEGRDKGKTFTLTEMPAMAGHKWACRALFALGAAGATIPDNLANTGMAGLAVMGVDAFIGGLSFELAEPLMDDLMRCVTINPDPSRPETERPVRVDSDIEEIQTIFSLQKAVFTMHTRPFILGGNPTTELSPQLQAA